MGYIESKLPIVTVPAGTPVETQPSNCRAELSFDEKIIGSDQVILFIDRSGSMDAPIRDDAEETRLDFAKAAAGPSLIYRPAWAWMWG